MWAKGYWPARYWPADYWPGVGVDAPEPTGLVGLELEAGTLFGYVAGERVQFASDGERLHYSGTPEDDSGAAR